MPYSAIFFENGTFKTIYLVLLAAEGELNIHLYGNDVPTAIAIEPGQLVRVPVEGVVSTCIKDGELKFCFHSHATLGATYFVPGRDLYKNRQGVVEGPIFAFETKPD